MTHRGGAESTEGRAGTRRDGENRTFRGREDWLAGSGAAVRVLDDPRCVALMERFIAGRPDVWNEDIGEE